MIDNAIFKLREQKIFFSTVSIYGLLFLRGYRRLLINCLNSKRSNFSFITVYFFTSTVFTFFTSTANPFIYFKNQFSVVFFTTYLFHNMLINFAEKESPQRVLLRPCSDERQKGLNCLKLKQNSFKPLKQSMFTSTTKTF